MKRFVHPPRYRAAALGLALLAAPAVAPAQSSPVSPIRIDLVTTNSDYLDNEAIGMRITVTNISGAEVNAQQGFFARDFHLLVDFIGPDGQVVRASAQLGGAEPGPPETAVDAAGALREAVPCELIAAGALTHRIVDDMRVYYDLSKIGAWRARVVTSLQTFSEAVITPRGRRCFVDDPNLRQVFTPLVSNLVRFSITRTVPIVESGIQAHAQLMIVGTGTHPPVSKSNIAGMPVKLIPEAAIPPYLHPINHKTFALIFDDVSSVKSGVTLGGGIVSFPPVPQEAYVLVARHESGVTVGAKIDADEPEWGTSDPILKKLKVMQNNKGKKSSAKATRRRGSDLWIVEPEYVEWDSTQEPYPFVFESVGDWAITTSVSPPEGFVADQPELSAEVNSETEAVQFTITDVGSSWKETKVKHKIKHKGKSEVIESEIGVKLSKKLAKEKGLPVYGETASPGTFIGGKKVKEDGEKKGKKLK